MMMMMMMMMMIYCYDRSGRQRQVFLLWCCNEMCYLSLYSIYLLT